MHVVYIHKQLHFYPLNRIQYGPSFFACCFLFPFAIYQTKTRNACWRMRRSDKRKKRKNRRSIEEHIGNIKIFSYTYTNIFSRFIIWYFVVCLCAVQMHREETVNFLNSTTWKLYLWLWLYTAVYKVCADKVFCCAFVCRSRSMQ